MKKLGVLFILVSLIIISCDKNQQVVKKLDGEWEVTAVNSEPVTDSTPSIFSKITFNECKLKDNEYCDGQITVSVFSIDLDFPTEYTVTNEGQKISFKNPLGDIDTANLFGIEEDILLDIVDLSSNELKVQNEGSILDLEKID